MANESSPSGGNSRMTTKTEAIPPIAEKVRFWQEQERINQAVIPRLVQLSEQVGQLAARLDRYETDDKIQSRLKRQDSLSGSRKLAWLAIAIAILALFGAGYAFLQAVA